MNAERVLIIGAHFDDSELGAGGTAARLVSEGKKVYKLTLTDNRTDFTQMGVKVDYDSSAKESFAASKILGVEEITSFVPESCSSLVYTKETMQSVEKIIYDLDIDTTFLHFKTDMNQDHVEASRICMTASRHCRNVLAYQGNGYILGEAYYPTYFVDISKFISLKKKALSQYGKEHNRFNSLFSINIERNHIWGYANRVEYAEGFHILKMVY